MEGHLVIVNQVYVISLPESEDRRERLRREWPYDMPLNFFDAIKHVRPSSGCLLSHMKLLGSLDEPTLILEDDAVFSKDFTLNLTPPNDWDVLWLGRQFSLPEIPINETWALTLPRMFRTHGYVAREPRTLANALSRIRVTNIDPTLNQLPFNQYALRVATIGQAAGPSTITGRDRESDMYWNE